MKNLSLSPKHNLTGQSKGESYEKEIIIQLNKKFEDAAYENQGVEYWMARDIQALLDYDEWRNFLKVIDKAKSACQKSRQQVKDHFVGVNKMVSLGSGSERQVDDIMLTRYACYLIAQNGDPRKEQIAFAQSYFAIQTRKQELLEERIAAVERITARDKLAATELELSGILYQRGVDSQGFARIRSKGDEALFGGRTTLQMKKKLGVPSQRPLADFLPTITIKAKDLAAEITHFNVRKKNLQKETPITYEHVKNNKDVRGLLVKSGIKPEELPPETDIKKIMGQGRQEQKKLAALTQKLPLIALLAFGPRLWAAPLEYRWGGPGHDPALQGEASSRLIARAAANDPALIEIVVDARETVSEVGRMDIALPSGAILSSTGCSKAMRHLTAPWACRFAAREIRASAGQGTLAVFDRSEKQLLTTAADLDEINRVLSLPSE